MKFSRANMDLDLHVMAAVRCWDTGEIEETPQRAHRLQTGIRPASIIVDCPPRVAQARASGIECGGGCRRLQTRLCTSSLSSSSSGSIFASACVSQTASVKGTGRTMPAL